VAAPEEAEEAVEAAEAAADPEGRAVADRAGAAEAEERG
jgi:hypothetical protein